MALQAATQQDTLALLINKGGPMRARNVVAFAVSVALAMSVLAQVSPNAGGAPGNAPIPVPAAELKWTDLDPAGAPGVKVADLWGDHQKGAFGAIFKLPAGFVAPLHTHTYDMKLVIISGTYIQGPEGKPKFRLGPGSYLMQPGGNYRHTTSCDQASDCVFFVESNGAFDLQPAAAVVSPAPK
jgi:quercetin dioxygenase-like cupin family protein